ncbi:TPA: hypothetical protein KZI03_000584 [Listeria monocytogenes]|nr:hypothetical protein [Listeria monocytogenes]HBI2193224.1 hypothetical protein [Listeria monocytogenes]
MNKKQKEVELAKLQAEEKELKHLKAIYNKASDDIAKKLKISNGKINVLLKDFDELDDVQKSILQSQIYQRNFQLSLKKQIDGFLSDLQTDQYKSIDEYLKGCYETGFLGSMYDLHGQGIPLVFPIDQKQAAAAIKLDPKISKNLYTKLGEDVGLLKKRIANNVSRGIATASEYKVIARNIAADSNVGFNRAMRIARTEGHGVQVQAAVDVQHKAKEKGADIVKQWDAALDKRTRESHRQVDGEIRELDEPFSNGMMHPSDPAGGAAEVVNCRCALLQRAKWALDDDELETLKERAAYYGLDKTKNFDDFRQKYLKAAENDSKIKIGKVLEKPIKSDDVYYDALLTKLDEIDVDYNPVKNHSSHLTEEEVIAALAGGDRTSGSCASLGLAYIGQRQGWDVLDFRGGGSQNFFSLSTNLFGLSKAKGIKTLKAEGKTSVTIGNRLLKQCEVGKEYYLVAGRHAAIVRKLEDSTLQYLELQSPTKSGWTNFNENPRYTLKTRFGCNTSANPYGDFMIDIDESDFSSDDFRSLIGYINTADGEQRKGKHGTVK